MSRDVKHLPLIVTNEVDQNIRTQTKTKRKRVKRKEEKRSFAAAFLGRSVTCYNSFLFPIGTCPWRLMFAWQERQAYVEDSAMSGDVKHLPRIITNEVDQKERYTLPACPIPCCSLSFPLLISLSCSLSIRINKGMCMLLCVHSYAHVNGEPLMLLCMHSCIIINGKLLMFLCVHWYVHMYSETAYALVCAFVCHYEWETAYALMFTFVCPRLCSCVCMHLSV